MIDDGGTTDEVDHELAWLRRYRPDGIWRRWDLATGKEIRDRARELAPAGVTIVYVRVIDGEVVRVSAHNAVVGVSSSPRIAGATVDELAAAVVKAMVPILAESAKGRR